MPFDHQAPLPVHYDGVVPNCGYIADIIVNGQAVLELRSV